MNEKLIYGIQQIGVGVDDAGKGFEWYGTRLGADACIFDDNNEATYMAKYMGGEPRKKRAILAMNLQGGSGYEIWQHTGRTPLKMKEPLDYGDLGINIAKVKSQNIQQSYDRLQSYGVTFLSDIVTAPDGIKCFYIQDPWDNILQIKEYDSWYKAKKHDMGGIFGATLGVSNIDANMKLFAGLLGYDQVIYDKTGTFEDISALSKGTEKFRRVLLTHAKDRKGGFYPLLGDSQIELVQRLDSKPKKLFENRMWGDIGFIHLCFDIKNMKKLVQECADNGFPFQVLSSESFDMGDANGHWGYIEDPDGTLIEFVETHKVPLIKKLNFNINLRNRDPHKPLPNWLIDAMKIKRRKF
ncbi:VOC family protein [Reichenbachiella agarivorans]|uniref:VOC family protein n=1 Tax=Reichenbachiella agarivorans TaxID=2979464 RepID=A0ABY6CT02_9BACT|nr:VOC family protein [Reichenbachiella agarivorans]UXP33469.1 VOC family protein [Reichenbachiella agarivorans]